ncbi:ABC transporter permease, partial [Sulfuracidifex tepidarius]
SISSGDYSPFVISGTLTFYISLGTITSVAQTLASERQSGRISLMIASGIPRELYIVSIMLTNGLSTLLVVPIIVFIGEVFLHVYVESIPSLVLTLALSAFMGSMLGTDLGFAFKNVYAVNQYSSIITFVLSFFAPVYYPPSAVSLPFRYLTYLEPTTYVSQAIFSSYSGELITSLEWCAGIIVYSIIFMIISRIILR